MYDKLSQSQQEILSRTLGILFIMGSIAGAIVYRHRMYSPNYFPIPDSTGHTFVQELSSSLFIIGVLVFVFGFIPTIFKLVKMFDSPTKKAAKVIKRYERNPVGFNIGGFASSQLRGFINHLSGNVHQGDYIYDDNDASLGTIPEFSDPPRELVLERINDTVKLFLFSTWAILIGLILFK